MRALIFPALLSLATAQLFPADRFLRWQWQSSIVDGNYLYILGGELYTLNQSTDTSAFVNYDSGIHAIDITKSWTTANVQGTTIATQDDTLKVRRPSIFHDSLNKSINVYGGWPYVSGSDATVPYVASWPAGSGTKVQAHARFGLDSGKEFGFTRKAGSLATASDTAYYSLGGFGTASTDPQFAGLADPLYQFTENGMLEIDYKGESITNTSTSFNRVHGEAQYIPSWGGEGVLVFIGGDKPSSQTYNMAASLVDMNIVTVYDIKTKKFYDQPTTGSTFPMGRSVFCSAAVSGSNSSYEIFIFGGIPGTVSTASQVDMGTVWILSIPAFQWTKTSAVMTWRYGNTCRILGDGKSQMLSIGGVGSMTVYTSKDEFPSGLGVFNLNTLDWQLNYDPSAKAYTPPSTISDMYDSKGNPKTAVTFSDPALTTIFKTSTSSTSTTPVPASSSSTAASLKAKTPIGAIVGGVIGGIAILAGLGFLGMLLLRRRRQQKHNEYSPAANVEADGSNHGYYVPENQVAGTHEMEVRPTQYELEVKTHPQQPHVRPYDNDRRNFAHELG